MLDMEPQLSRCPRSKEEAKPATVMRRLSKRKQEDQSQLGAQGSGRGRRERGVRRGQKACSEEAPSL